MASEVISFRMPRKQVEMLRKRGMNPNAFAKEALEVALRRIEIDESLERIAKSGVVLKEDPVGIIRRDRESH